MMRRTYDQAACFSFFSYGFRRISHDNPQAGVKEHGQVVFAVSNGHHIIERNAVAPGEISDTFFFIHLWVHDLDTVGTCLDHIKTIPERILQILDHRLPTIKPRQYQQLGR